MDSLGKNSALEHNLSRYFEALCRFNSTREMEQSEFYRRVEPEIRTVLEAISQESFDGAAGFDRPWIRATAWNIERGTELGGLVRTFREHPVLKETEIFVLTELDYGMARSGNRRVPQELAETLGLNYAFAPSYINLEKGSGLESQVTGENELGLHGNAIMSPYPLHSVHTIPLPNGKDKMRGKEKRLGCQRALAGIVEHPLGPVRIVSVHLDAHSTQKHRMRQMRLVLDDLDRFSPGLPVLIGGDWNTSTYNSRTALFSILGYCRRVAMGVRHVINNHYPYPDRWFERHLFRELERRGFNYRDLNVPGGCTLHYDVNDIAANGRMADWIPNWCFWFINWALERNRGRCSFKLDWFAGKGIRPAGDHPPQIIGDVHSPEKPLSDHDPIVLDFIYPSDSSGVGSTEPDLRLR